MHVLRSHPSGAEPFLSWLQESLEQGREGGRQTARDDAVRGVRDGDGPGVCDKQRISFSYQEQSSAVEV